MERSDAKSIVSPSRHTTANKCTYSLSLRESGAESRTPFGQVACTERGQSQHSHVLTTLCGAKERRNVVNLAKVVGLKVPFVDVVAVREKL